MKRIISALLLLAVLVSAGCTKNFERYNTDPYAVTSADPTILLPTMLDALMYVQQNDSQMIDQMVGTYGGYFTLSNRWQGQNFDTFNQSDDWNAGPYNTPFIDIYTNFFEIEDYTSSSGHFYAIARLIRAAAMMRVADCYGPIPYSQIMDGKMYVAYDSNEDVYLHIIDDLKQAAAILYAYAQENPDSHPIAAQDLIYDGDYAFWAKLANSYIMRAAMRTGNQAEFVSAMNSPYGYIETNADNALMNCGVQTCPYNLASSSAWGDLRANASIVDYMNGYSDPRRPEYFTFSSFSGYTTQYVGMPSGKAEFEKNDVAPYSSPNFPASGAGSELPVFVAAESSFLIAEAILKGWVSGNAKDYYEEGIKLSMEQWGVSGTAITSYIADDTSVPDSHTGDPIGFATYNRTTQVKIAWNAAGTQEEQLEQIITQKWIANYPMGLEAWADYRRTGYPELAPSVDDLSNGVVDRIRGARRLSYPYTEKSLNSENYPGAVSLLDGPDNMATDLFWAKKKN